MLCTLNIANRICHKLISSLPCRCSSTGDALVATLSPLFLASVCSNYSANYYPCSRTRNLQSAVHTTTSSLVKRGVFAVLQHWLAVSLCPVTWYHTDGHVSETQTRRAATRSQQTHTDTQLRPLKAREKKIIKKIQRVTFWKYDSVEWIRLQYLKRPMHAIYRL